MTLCKFSSLCTYFPIQPFRELESWAFCVHYLRIHIPAFTQMTVDIVLGPRTIPLEGPPLYSPKGRKRQIWLYEYKFTKYKKQLGRNTNFLSLREMVDKGRIVLGPPRRYPPPLSRGTRERQERHPPSCASRLSATCAKPPVCLLLASPV